MAENKGRTESGKDTRSAAEDASHSAKGGAKQAADKASEAARMAANGAEEISDQASNNFAAIMECGPILADGFQSIWREWITCNQNVLSQNVEGLNKIMRSRTINDLLAAQSDLLKSELQMLIDSSVRISELSARVANDAANKINERSQASLEQARRRA